MDLEELTQKLTNIMPKPMLVVVVLLGFILIYVGLIEPPRTICATVTENFIATQKGILTPIKEGKRTYAGKIVSTMDSCRLGNSGGSCFEYLGILRRTASTIKNAPNECVPELLGVSVENYQRTEYYAQVKDGDRVREELSNVTYATVNVQQVFEDGIDMLVRKAWGTEPPEPGPMRYGWLAESELAVFCHLQDVVKPQYSAEGWAEFQKKIYEKLPGEKPPEVFGGGNPIPARPATQLFPEPELRRRTIFSVTCGSYR